MTEDAMVWITWVVLIGAGLLLIWAAWLIRRASIFLERSRNSVTRAQNQIDELRKDLNAR